MTTVLVADDDDDIRDVIAEFMAEEGYTVLKAANGIEALEQTLSLKPEIVILDQRMPGLTGTEVVRQIRNAGSHATTILITAASDVAKLAEGAGASYFLGKPFSLEDLSELLSRANPMPPEEPLQVDGTIPRSSTRSGSSGSIT